MCGNNPDSLEAREIIDDMNASMELVRYLVNERKERGISVRDMAEITGYGRKTIRRIERHEQSPYMSELQTYARGLGLKLSFQVVPSESV